MSTAYDPHQNFFPQARAQCPRCFQLIQVDKFMLSGGDNGGVWMTFNCPACTDQCQVRMENRTGWEAL